MEYTYQRNVKLINLLYNSDFAKILCAENTDNSWVKLRPTINSFYKDPDVYDDVEKICGRNTLESTIKLGLDGLCGWKMLFDIHEGKIEWLEDYQTIRGSKLGYLLWPNSTDNRTHPTINQLRYNVYGDRIDYTLYDINLFLTEKNSNKCKLSKAYKGETKEFLEKYKNIKEFIYDNNTLLEVFLDKNGKVLNILTEKTLDLEEINDFKFSNRWGVKNNKEVWKKYIKKVVELCGNAEKLNVI